MGLNERGKLNLMASLLDGALLIKVFSAMSAFYKFS
jgi:hypothetical protein